MRSAVTLIAVAANNDALKMCASNALLPNFLHATDLSGAIRSVSVATGIIRTVAGSGNKITSGSTGNGGPATVARFNSPMSVTYDGVGGFYVVRISEDSLHAHRFATVMTYLSFVLLRRTIPITLSSG